MSYTRDVPSDVLGRLCPGRDEGVRGGRNHQCDTRETRHTLPADLGVEDAAYLNALAEAASELRRDVLDSLRDDLERADGLLEQMDEIYSVLDLD